MRFWVELKGHVPNGQTVTSLLRFYTFNTKQTYNESMSGGKGVAAVTTTIRVQKIVTVQDYMYRTTVTLVSCNRIYLPSSPLTVVLVCTRANWPIQMKLISISIALSD